VLTVGSYLPRNGDKDKNLVLAKLKIFEVLRLPLVNFKSLKYKHRLVFSSFFMRSLQKSSFQLPKYYPYSFLQIFRLPSVRIRSPFRSHHAPRQLHANLLQSGETATAGRSG